MRNFLPLLPPLSQPFRSLMQYCFSLVGTAPDPPFEHRSAYLYSVLFS